MRKAKEPIVQPTETDNFNKKLINALKKLIGFMSADIPKKRKRKKKKSLK